MKRFDKKCKETWFQRIQVRQDFICLCEILHVYNFISFHQVYRVPLWVLSMCLTSPRIHVTCHGRHPEKMVALRSPHTRWRDRRSVNPTGPQSRHTAR